MPSNVPPKLQLLRTAETLLIAAAGAAVFHAIGFPAGLVTGSLLCVAAAALLGRPMMVPPHLARVVSVLVGIALGAVVTPETLRGVITFPLSIAVLTASTVCMIVATTYYLRLVHGWDARSAVCGASPGALAQVMVLAAENGADLRAVAIVQVVRVVLLTIGIPAGLALFGLSATETITQRAGGVPFSLTEFAVVLAVSTSTAFLAMRFRLPGGLLFGAMLGSGFLHGAGLVHSTLPSWLVIVAVIGVGAFTGSRFSNTAPRLLLRYIGAALGSFAVAISVAGGFVLLLTALLTIRIPDAVVAFAPGAQDTMMVLALSLHLDPIFVGAHHLWRFMLVSLSLPFQVRRAGKALPAAKDAAPPRPRLPFED
jgi:uncharacterized protein